jgi:hypothetical protein
MFLDDPSNYKFTDMDIAEGSSANWSYPSWPSHLDHIMITNELFDVFEKPGSEVLTIKIDDYLQGGWSEYDQYVSDHRPVGLKLHTREASSIVDNEIPGLRFYNYPNPFKRKTTFVFDMTTGETQIDIMNSAGQLIERIFTGKNSTSATWDAGETPPGIYQARFTTPDGRATQTKTIILK